MAEDSSYFIKVTSPNGLVFENIFKEKGECDFDDEAIIRKSEHFIVNELTPNFTYTISLTGNNGLGGDISYASTKIYTFRSL